MLCIFVRPSLRNVRGVSFEFYQPFINREFLEIYVYVLRKSLTTSTFSKNRKHWRKWFMNELATNLRVIHKVRCRQDEVGRWYWKYQLHADFPL